MTRRALWVERRIQMKSRVGRVGVRGEAWGWQGLLLWRDFDFMSAIGSPWGISGRRAV